MDPSQHMPSVAVSLLKGLPLCDHIVWDNIGTELRSETVRFSSDVQCRIHSIITAALDAMTKGGHTTCLSVLRVLINLAADSDENRKRLVDSQDESCARLWTFLRGRMTDDNKAIADRILLLLLQFFTNTDAANRHRDYFSSLDICNAVASRYIMQSTTCCGELLTLLHPPEEDVSGPTSCGFDEITIIQIISQSIDNLLLLSENSGDGYTEEYDDNNPMLILSTLVYQQCAQLKKSCNRIPVWIDRVLSVLSSVPESIEAEELSIRRNLFSTVGILSSTIDAVNNESFYTVVDGCISQIFKVVQDPYVLSAACIALGNCVFSDVARSAVNSRIIRKWGSTEEFIQSFCGHHLKITDPLQLQKIHLLINMMDKDSAPPMAARLKAFGDLLLKPTLDNAPYYPQIASLAYKFSCKILRVYFIPTGANVLPYRRVWDALVEAHKTSQDSRQVALLLLQTLLGRTEQHPQEKIEAVEGAVEDDSSHKTYIFDDLLFTARLITIAVTLPVTSQISSEYFLEVLKTLGMLCFKFTKIGEGWNFLLDVYNRDDATVESEFATPLLALLKNLVTALETNEEGRDSSVSTAVDNPQSRTALKNNLRFLAITLTRLCQDELAASNGKELLLLLAPSLTSIHELALLIASRD